MRAHLLHFALVDDDDLVRLLDGAQSMRDEDHRLALEIVVDGLLDKVFAFCKDTVGGRQISVVSSTQDGSAVWSVPYPYPMQTWPRREEELQAS